MIFSNDNGALIARRQGETLRIEAWGTDSLRVRASMNAGIRSQDWALSETPVQTDTQVEIFVPDGKRENTMAAAESAMPVGSGSAEEQTPVELKPDQNGCGVITNGRIRAIVNWAGVISYYKWNETTPASAPASAANSESGSEDVLAALQENVLPEQDGHWTLILREYNRNYGDALTRESRCLKIVSREWKGLTGGEDYRLNVKFESNDGEKLFGMGQYQQPWLDHKGSVLELEQRNSQISVPFAVSSLGYGFLWNNPAVGRVTFGKNYTEWIARATKQMDYWITAADTPKEILASYTAVTGHAPMFPEDRMGLWQCKLRYRTQAEVLEIAHKYQEEGIHIDQIVIDFFHWTVQGDWKFDKTYWPDPKAMVDELHSMGIKVIVSVWPSVDRRSENFEPMFERGLLMKTERGAAQTYDYQGDCVEIDPFNPETREYVWEVCRRNYYDYGIDAFWLDNSEPDLGVYDFENYRYYEGSALSCSNLYPQMYSRIFYDKMSRMGDGAVVNLLRCGWAGSQKYGNVIWSGDVPSTFEGFRDQLQAGLNMGLAGIPWWTTDIGGFMTDDVNDPDFRQLLIRWYQFAVYSAVLRMHGDRGPYDIPPLDDRDWGGGYLHTGQPNELWSYGEDNYRIMRSYYDLRISLHDYIRSLYQEAHENGSPLIRTMFYEFPEDSNCWELTDQYMFGSQYLVAPILYLNQYQREVYLPAGEWKLTSTGECFRGGQTVTVDAPIEYMPVFEKQQA
ncbi:MAG: family 31 glucosidase [Lachnospiraceae bacterium]|nr:family 31 glucosidase [Lachnospiraceae bacterium]